MKLESLHELFIEELQDLYSAENQILEALPKMIDKAQSPDLRRGFQSHLEQTRGHVRRLDQILISWAKTLIVMTRPAKA